MAIKEKLYKYRAVKADGANVRGVLSANNENHLYERLEEVGLHLIKSSEVKGGAFGGARYFARISLRDKIQLYTAMGQMMEAGISVLEAIDHSRKNASTSAMRDLLNTFHQDVYDGLKFSEVMTKHSNVFTDIEVALIKSSEERGDLSVGCDALVHHLTEKDDTRRKIKKAVQYPAVLLVVISGALFVMMAYVVPQILEFLKVIQDDIELTIFTKSLISVSGFFQNYVLWLFFGIAALIVLHIALLKSSLAYKTMVDKFALKIPMIGDLIRKIEIAWFCNVLASLYKAGIPVINALKFSNEMVRNEVLNSSISMAIEQIKQGSTLRDAFNNTGEFPSVVVHMISIGEESANLEETLNKVCEFYRKDIDDAIQAMILLIEPILTIFLAAMIMWIAIAVFGPIYDLFETMI